MNIRKIIRLFRKGNCLVYGLRGDGKDMLMSNVVIRRKLPYVSNINYGGQWYPLDFEAIDCGKNTYKNFISGQVNPYTYPYPDGTDIYISDAGVYLPSQYCNELNRDYKYLPTFLSLSRHTGNCNYHCNAQSIGRIYDKVREQCDQYILCRFCFYIPFLRLVIQGVRIYDQYDSALAKRRPFHRPRGGGRLGRLQAKIAKEEHLCAHGYIKNGILIYRNKSHYNTRHFKDLMKGDTLET